MTRRALLAVASAVAFVTSCSDGSMSPEPPPPAPGTVAVAATTYTVGEATPTVTVTVRRTGGASGIVSTAFSLAASTAHAWDDYEDDYGVLTWADGDAADKTVTIWIVSDALAEGDETFSFRLATPTNGATLGAAEATITIDDDDTPAAGALRFTAQEWEVDEDVPTATITVERSGGSTGTVSVICSTGAGTATVGDDYAAAFQVLTWADGDTAPKTLTVPIVNDDLPEPYEAVPIELRSPTGGAVVATPAIVPLTIRNDDTVLRLGAPTYRVGENGGTLWVPVAKTGETAAVTVRADATGGTATAGADFTLTANTLGWLERDTRTLQFPIAILQDALREGDETIVVSLGSATAGATVGTPSSATITIVDDEAPLEGLLVFTQGDFPVSNYAGAVTVSVARVLGTTGTVGVSYATSDGTAVAGQDYGATSGTLSWGPGDAAVKTFTVPITDDLADETPETIALTLSSPTGGAALGPQQTAKVTISDDWASGRRALWRSATGLWDSWDDIESPSVVRLGPASFVMYYQGGNNAGNLNTQRRIGRAVSTDGLAWTREPPAAVTSGWVLGAGDPGKFDEFGVGKPSVLFDGAKWHMWYSNQSLNVNDDVAAVPRIGYATSDDGITWTRQNGGDAVLAGGTYPAPDAAGVSGPCVVLDGTTYRMWYTAHQDTFTEQIAYATSPDGVTWTKQGVVLPVLILGTYDSYAVSEPAVVKDGDTYRMWYSSRTISTSTWLLGYAEAVGGGAWERFGVSLFDPYWQSWDDGPISGPFALKDGERWLLWYDADAIYGGGIGLATNP